MNKSICSLLVISDPFQMVGIKADKLLFLKNQQELWVYKTCFDRSSINNNFELFELSSLSNWRWSKIDRNMFCKLKVVVDFLRIIPFSGYDFSQIQLNLYEHIAKRWGDLVSHNNISLFWWSNWDKIINQKSLFIGTAKCPATHSQIPSLVSQPAQLSISHR